MSKASRSVFIQTFGCQMNEYDSEQMLQVLAQEGFEKTEQIEAADLILINSCAVREKSETKALSFLGRLGQIKKSNERAVIGFGGCVGQTEGPRLVNQFHFLDFSFGTNNYRELPQMIKKYERRWKKSEDFDVLLPSSRPEAKSQAFITITNGCDKFCSYCIVPFTRGREISRTPEEILNEAAALTAKGIKEIMLLGQNVNSYWGKNKDGAFRSLYDLLVSFQEKSESSLKGLSRLRYTTSHPRDFDENLARAFKELPLLCEFMHLPFQAGSNQVLRRMRRFYTAESYLKKLEMLRSYVPDIALSTDIIVGFPGETKEDFQETMKIVREVEFDNIYSFVYSERKYTRSAEWPDDVSAEEKSERLAELQTLQKQHSVKKYREDLGKEVEIMLEGPSKGTPDFWTGRTRKNRVVHLPTEAEFSSGDIFNAKILETTHSWMKAERVFEGPSKLQSLA